MKRPIRGSRRLRFSVSGRWYIGLTIALGVVALASGNNVLYLIESLILSGMILSGILSERQVSAIQFDVEMHPAIAGQLSQDRFRVRNTRRFPVFCVEIGEWKEGKFHHLSYIPKLSGKTSGIFPGNSVFGKRGIHEWQALAVATSYPFGLAQKIKIIPSAGSRLIWPERATELGSLSAPAPGSGQSLRHGLFIADGEVRAMNHDDDSRMIVWTLSAKGTDPLVRIRRSESEDPQVVLDLTLFTENFEEKVQQTALPFHQQILAHDFHGGVLTILRGQGKKKIHGAKQALDELATLTQPPPPSSEKDAA